MKTDEQIISDSRIWQHMSYLGMDSSMVKLPDCGTCTCVWGRNENGYEHVSVSPVKKFRIPSWDDMAALKDIFFDDEEEVYQIMPKKSEYVNITQNCLHLWRPVNGITLADIVKMEAKDET